MTTPVANPIPDPRCPDLKNESIEQESLATPSVESTTSLARKSVIWNTGFSLFRDLAQFVQAVILARLLLPEAYGQFALVTSSIGFLSIFTSKNFVAYTLQVKDDNETHFQDHFTAGAVLQLGMFLLANLVAIGVRFIPDYESIAVPIHVMSTTFLVEWPTEIRLKMLERALDWKRRRLLHAVGIVLSILLAIVMATLGMGVYALLVPGILVTGPFIYDLFIYAKFRPTWQWSWDHYRAAFRFGMTRIGAGAALTGRQLLENAVFSATLGFTALGLVNRAVGISQLACGKIAGQLMYAIYPILTRLETTTGKAAFAGDLVMRVVAWTAIPLACCFGLLGLPVIATIYGSQWLDAAVFLRWTLAWVTVMALMQVAYALLLARQKAKLCMAADLSVLIGTGVCLFLLLPRGVTTYYAGLTFVYAATLAILVWILVGCSAITVVGLRRAFLPPTIGSVLAAALTNTLLPFDAFSGTAFLPAAAWGTTFFLLYIACLRLLFVSPLRELISYVPARDKVARVLHLSL